MSIPDSSIDDLSSSIQLLQALYPLPSELTLSPSTSSFLSSPSPSSSSPPPSLDLTLRVILPPSRSLDLSIALITSQRSSAPPLIAIRCPSWLSRQTHRELEEAWAREKGRLEQGEGAQWGASEWVERAREWVLDWAERREEVGDGAEEVEKDGEKGQLVRAWLYLPSLSTREKRKHLVDWAPTYNITGFVLAGKPGILCLEADAEGAIEAYMAEIKSRSWADIPSHQKKVTERYRTSPPSRAFSSMEEITDLFGRYGERGNRGEMGEVVRWLEGREKGLGEVFRGKVLGLGGGGGEEG